MRYAKTKALLAGALLVSLAACGGGGGGSTVKVDVNKDAKFPSGSTMAKLQDAGKIKIGVKIDQPGIGFKDAGSDVPEGFDIEMGRIVAAGMGLSDDQIEWVTTISDNREPFLQKGTVDIVIASYSITDERRQIVGQAGPYYVTGQQLLVAADDDSIKGPDDLDGKKVCSVTGSTSIETVEKEYGANPAGFDSYSECVTQLQNGNVDAVTTDGAILLGYAAQDPDNLKVVGDPFSEERYGVGYKKGDTEFCQYITDTIQKAMDDGKWADAFKATLGKSGVDTPEPPKMDPCE
ncbi:MAG: glutamate ABC transporter substrate-binding protein [Nocardioidaceae bacterium]|nr:glutamate ABC transporter substrate-binding protein [Nocardioidaceae bacterium]